MNKTFIGIRDVDEETFRKFRALALLKRLKLGDALTKAMRDFLGEKDNKKAGRKKLRIKPFDWGKGTEKTSKEIDAILYG